MATYIVKLGNFYLEWSTIIDAPITLGMTLDQFKRYYKEEYGNYRFEQLPYRLERVEEYGTSQQGKVSPEDLIVGNCAGPNETELNIQELFDNYCSLDADYHSVWEAR